MKLLSIVLPLLSLLVTNAEPLFLFSGQSNMLGHSSDDDSVGGNADLQNYVFHDFLDNPKEETLKTMLNEAYAFREMKNQNHVAKYQAKLLMELYEQGVFDAKISLNHSSAKCFCNDPSHRTRGHPETPTPVSPFVNCGVSYSHELMFSHTLSSQNPSWENVPFTVAKVAVGGTEIYKDWYPGSGTYWEDLNRTIHSTPGEWHGFAWHQGENDCFTWKHDGGTAEDTSYTYLGNLTDLVAAVRTEIFRANPDGQFITPSDIPVAIFALHHWPQGEQRGRIVEAQKAFVESDDNTVLIESEDLSQFYHLDPVSLLITGNRLANTWSTILPDPDYVLPSKYDDDDDIAETIVIAAAAILLVSLIVFLCWICRVWRRRKMAKAMFSEETTGDGLMLVPLNEGVDGTNGIIHGRKNDPLHPYQDEPLQSPAGRAII